MKNVDTYRVLIAHGFQHEEAETVIKDLKNDEGLATKNDLALAVSDLKLSISQVKTEIKSTALALLISMTTIFAVFLSALAYVIKH